MKRTGIRNEKLGEFSTSEESPGVIKSRDLWNLLTGKAIRVTQVPTATMAANKSLLCLDLPSSGVSIFSENYNEYI